MPVRVGINGFGRIGRSFYRAILARGDQAGVELVAVNDPFGDAHTMAFLLKHDSVGGTIANEVKETDGGFSVDGREIKKLESREPGEIPWGDNGVDVVIESTGLFTARDKAAEHLKGGAQRVIISAPSGDADVMICLGVNDGAYDAAKHTVLSNASCTTNCLAPLARVLHERFGIEQGFITTVHAYTTDQQLQDQAVAQPVGQAGPAADAGRRALDHPEHDRRGACDRQRHARSQGQARRHLAARSDPDRFDHRPRRDVEDRREHRRRQRRVRGGCRRRELPRRAEVQRRAPRVGRHRRRPVVVHLLVARHDGERPAGQGARLVRQRVGLLQPPRRPRRVRRE